MQCTKCMYMIYLFSDGKRKDMTKQNNKYDNNMDCCCKRLIIEQNNFDTSYRLILQL